MMLSAMHLLILANQHPGLCGSIALSEAESINQKKYADFASVSLVRYREIRHYQLCKE